METEYQIKKVYHGDKIEMLKEISIEIKITEGISTDKFEQIIAEISEEVEPLLME
jgi:hypothetical protein